MARAVDEQRICTDDAAQAAVEDDARAVGERLGFAEIVRDENDGTLPLEAAAGVAEVRNPHLP